MKQNFPLRHGKGGVQQCLAMKEHNYHQRHESQGYFSINGTPLLGSGLREDAAARPGKFLGVGIKVVSTQERNGDSTSWKRGAATEKHQMVSHL